MSAGQEGPVTTAVLLRGERFFLDCLDDPPRTERTQWSWLTRSDVFCRILQCGEAVQVQVCHDNGRLYFAGVLYDIDAHIVGVGRWSVELTLRPVRHVTTPAAE